MICENCGAQVDERVGVCPFCGVIQTQAKRWKQQFFVSPDHCCLCGKALNGRYQVLFTYASGDEARICEDCASLIASARNRRDPAAAQTALTRLNGMLSSEALDPAVSDQLRQIAGETERWLNSLRAAPPVQPQPQPPAKPVRAGANKAVLLISLLVILLGIALIIIGAFGGFSSARREGAAPSPTAFETPTPAPSATPTPYLLPSLEPYVAPTVSAAPVTITTPKPAGISTPIPQTTPTPGIL